MPSPDHNRAARAASFSAGYSLFVRLLKIALPLAALVIVGIVAARLSKSPLQQAEIVPSAARTTPGDIELAGARYEGTDERGRPYTLIADRARRAPGSADTVLLDNLKADITLEDKTWLAVSAASGSYAATAQKLELSGGVSVFHDSGYEMHLETAEVDLKTRAARGSGPVRAQGPAGEIAAAALEVKNGGNLVVFPGPATLRLRNLGRAG